MHDPPAPSPGRSEGHDGHGVVEAAGHRLRLPGMLAQPPAPIKHEFHRPGPLPVTAVGPMPQLPAVRRPLLLPAVGRAYAEGDPQELH